MERSVRQILKKEEQEVESEIRQQKIQTEKEMLARVYEYFTSIKTKTEAISYANKPVQLMESYVGLIKKGYAALMLQAQNSSNATIKLLEAKNQINEETIKERKDYYESQKSQLSDKLLQQQEEHSKTTVLLQTKLDESRDKIYDLQSKLIEKPAVKDLSGELLEA